ncbi:tol-pal system-associated acyl-CoA thioesterase [Sphingomonas sp.]|jgi:acyl-CoA thioester hydrolase|uniref:tol-pal system-associated acyl-CoA thioesterase n=1 Tax=Sphingomonas sp. TaxID=28214 RepID=UPI0035C852AB
MPDLAPPSGRIDDGLHLFPVRVYFEDTDLSGVVYHANYLRFMERARSDMLRLAGIDQRATFDATGAAYVVAELAIRYRAPARLDDALTVTSRVTDVRAASVTIQQTVSRDTLILAEADVVAAWVKDGRPRRQPAEWIASFRMLIQPGERP